MELCTSIGYEEVFSFTPGFSPSVEGVLYLLAFHTVSAVEGLPGLTGTRKLLTCFLFSVCSHWIIYKLQQRAALDMAHPLPPALDRWDGCHFANSYTSKLDGCIQGVYKLVSALKGAAIFCITNSIAKIFLVNHHKTVLT